MDHDTEPLAMFNAADSDAVVVSMQLAPLAGNDLALVDAAVTFLNDAIRQSGVQLAVTVSDYVVAQFFGGDPALLSSHDPHRGNCYRALCQRPDLQMGDNTLRRLVRIGVQVRVLPADVAQRLSPAQHRALLVVPEPARKLALAQQALAENWSVPQLAAAASAQPADFGDAQRRGRRPQPELVKQVAAAVKGPRSWLADDSFEAAFAGLGETERAVVVAGLREMRDAASVLLARVEA